MNRTASVAALLALLAATPVEAISIVLDYSIDEQNENWFDPTDADGLARRLALNAAADFLSAIIANDDWSPLPALEEAISFTDIAASSIRSPTGELLFGTPESDGVGFSFSVPVSDDRSGVRANEYVVYAGAFAFDAASLSVNAKAGWDSNDRRNAAGSLETEFNTWGGRLYFNTANEWYAGQPTGADPTDDYGVQDPNKSPAFDTPSDNWEWSTADDAWKGFDLASVDPTANGVRDLYGTALHELLHALGATSSVIRDYVGVDASGDFTGPALVAEYGGPVPGDGGHFAENTESIVWASGDIVSETLLDPNSRFGVRKYLTRLDAALLADLGYEVSSTLPSGFLQGDYNADGRVDAADYTLWRDATTAPTELPNDPSFTEINLDDRLAWAVAYGHASGAIGTPEPTAFGLTILAGFGLLTLRSAPPSSRRQRIGRPGR